MANEFKVKNGLSIGGITSGTTILKSASAASGTLTLPAATDTLVGLATTDTLTNKTLSSVTLTGTVTAGNGVGTSGQVLSSTGTGVQWVNAGAGDVTQTGTQTLTNKTLTSPTINGATLTGTVTIDGLQYPSADGTNGQVLSTNGAGQLIFATVSGGGVTVGGYNNSSSTAFPSGDFQGTESYIGSSGVTNDAFGVSLLAIFTCMDPVGSLQSTDLGLLT